MDGIPLLALLNTPTKLYFTGFRRKIGSFLIWLPQHERQNPGKAGLVDWPLVR
jgi:hypothetical protein